MSEIIKRVNGHAIKELSRNEINDELIANGDWTIEYYVPGRTFNQFFINVNRRRYRCSKYEQIEKFCRKYKPQELKGMESYEIEKLMWNVMEGFIV